MSALEDLRERPEELPPQFQEGGLERLKRLDFAVPQSEMADHRGEFEDYFRKDPPGSAGEAAAAIERLAGIRRGPSQVRKSPTGVSLKCRKLGMIPSNADAAEHARSLDEKLRPRPGPARRLKRVVCFVDAAHFVHGTYLGYLWCFARLSMRDRSGRKRFNVLWAIDVGPHELTTVCNETVINAETVWELLRKLSARYVGLTMTPVLDNARYHRCASVRQVARELPGPFQV